MVVRDTIGRCINAVVLRGPLDALNALCLGVLRGALCCEWHRGFLFAPRNKLAPVHARDGRVWRHACTFWAARARLFLSVSASVSNAVFGVHVR